MNLWKRFKRRLPSRCENCGRWLREIDYRVDPEVQMCWRCKISTLAFGICESEEPTGLRFTKEEADYWQQWKKQIIEKEIEEVVESTTTSDEMSDFSGSTQGKKGE